MLRLSLTLVVGSLYGCRSNGIQVSNGSPLDWEASEEPSTPDAQGGSSLPLTLPFPAGKYWVLTQGYDQGTHIDYGGDHSDETYAMDFTRNGCEAYGETVTPLYPGKVIMIVGDNGNGTGFGNTILIGHDNGYVSRYAHFSEILVDIDEEVSINTPIGLVGNTGYVSGVACSEYPGTHLHVSLYKDKEATPLSPLSGLMELKEGCWYTREGWESCSGDPGHYEDDEEEDVDWNEEVQDEGEMVATGITITPEQGIAEVTEYIWTSVIVSPDAKPTATLRIHNPNDQKTYDFPMETQSEESPWVFTYQKTLHDANTTYTYWVESTNGDGNSTTEVQQVRTDDSRGSDLEIHDFEWSPEWGYTEDTEFQWELSFVSEDEDAEATLWIVNPKDATIYPFEMNLEGGFWFTGEYEKTLRDPTTYTFWVTVEDRYGSQNTDIGHIQVEE